jgi:hypothetical protein
MGRFQLFLMPSDRSGRAERVDTPATSASTESYDPTGRAMAYTDSTFGRPAKVMITSLDGSVQPQPLDDTKFAQGSPKFSPDGLTSVSGFYFADLKKGKDIPVGIGDLEAPQAIVYERQLFHERHTPLAELFEEHVGVQGVDVRIPTSPSMSGVVWTWQHVGKDGLEHDADPVSAHSTVVRAVVWTLEVKLEAEALDVVGDRGL